MSPALLPVLVLLAGCGHIDPVELAILQKTTADGIGGAYLDYCEIVVRPRCIASDKDAQDRGAPQTKADRIACLRPCDSASAQRVADEVDTVRTSQTALYLLLQENASADELRASREQLAHDVERLSALLRELGVFDKLGKALGR